MQFERNESAAAVAASAEPGGKCRRASDGRARRAVRPARLPGVALLGLGLLAAQPALGQTAATAQAVSTAADRSKVSITVYNQNFGLVREVRKLGSLRNGRLSLEVRDVAASIQPETVHIRALGQAQGFTVLEQNYRYDLLTPETLLEKFVGRKIRFHRYHESTAREEVVDAELLSVAGGPVVRVGSEITFNYPGRIGFGELPDNLIAKPTLVWLAENRQPEQTLEVSYLANELNWNADYVLVLDEQERQADLTGWVTLVNQSGSSYRAAELKLVAGDVQRVRPPPPRPEYGYEAAAARDVAQNAFQQEGLFEYHLYTLSRPTTVLHNERKQVSLLEARGVGVEKQLIFRGEQYWFRAQGDPGIGTQKVSVYLQLENSEKNRLGLPLPKGTLRVYKADRSGAQQFVGEDTIDHTPRDEKIKVKVGEAFDVVAERKQTRFSSLGQCGSESGWQIELRNHKDEAVKVEVIEPAGGDWTIVNSSLPAERRDAHSFAFQASVPARGKTLVSYVVRVRWC